MPTFSITRTARTSAPVEAVLPLIQDFHEWVIWSPWEGLDSRLERTYSGPPCGAGASYAWCGNKAAGEGSMEMLRADGHGARIALRLREPVRADTILELRVSPSLSGGSELSWTISGRQTLTGRVLAVAGRADATLARDLDRGLRQLGFAAEKCAAGA